MAVNPLKLLSIVDRHWACEDNYANGVLHLLSEMDLAAHIRDYESRRMPSNSEDRPSLYTVDNGVGILSMKGPITKEPTSMSFMFGGSSVVEAIAAIDSMEADKSVKSAAIKVDSPGGSVSGIQTLYSRIKDFNKPIVAYADDLMASAAFWYSCGCDYIYAADGSILGSFGTRTVVEDTSELAKKEGFKVYSITNKNGEFKAIGVPGVAISEAQIEELQRQVDSIHDGFASAIAYGRGWTKQKALAMSDGKVYSAKDALSMGIIDGIASFDEVLANLRSGSIEKSKRQTSAANTESGKSKEKVKMENEEKVVAEQNASFLDSLKAALGIGGSNHNASGNSQYQATAQIPMVAATLAVHPLVSACQAAGINSVEDLNKLQSRATLANELEAEFRAETEKLCIMAYGQEGAEAFLSAVKDTNVPLSAVRNIRKSADAAYDKAFPSASARQTEAGDPNAQGASDVPIKGGLEGSIEAAVSDIGEQSSAIPAFLKNGANVKVGK